MNDIRKVTVDAILEIYEVNLEAQIVSLGERVRRGMQYLPATMQYLEGDIADTLKRIDAITTAAGLVGLSKGRAKKDDRRSRQGDK